MNTPPVTPAVPPSIPEGFRMVLVRTAIGRPRKGKALRVLIGARISVESHAFLKSKQEEYDCSLGEVIDRVCGVFKQPAK